MQLQAAANGGSISENIKGNTFNKAPEVTVNLTAQYFQSVGRADITYRLDYYWQDQEFYGQFNDKYLGQDDYSLVNASVALTTWDESWQMVLFAENLTDEDDSSYGFDFSNLGTALSINPPRIWGIRAIYQFD